MCVCVKTSVCKCFCNANYCLVLRYFVLILFFSTAYNTSLRYWFVLWCLHTNKRRPCSFTLSGHPSSSFQMCFETYRKWFCIAGEIVLPSFQENVLQLSLKAPGIRPVVLRVFCTFHWPGCDSHVARRCRFRGRRGILLDVLIDKCSE